MEGASGFVQNLSDEQANALKDRAARKRFPKGSTLLSEGDVSGRVMLLESGRVKVGRLTPDGREVILALKGAGELLGDLSAIDGEPISATVSALEEVEVLVLSAKDFRTFLADTPGVALKLLELNADRLREAGLKRSEFGGNDAVSRVAARLVEMADRFGVVTDEGLRVSVPLSQEEMAAFIGASRETVSKALQTFRGTGLITTERRWITVLDIERLRQRAN